LPFKDKAFDFVIASHVLEHTPDPEKFLTELQRVAHAGYIETPDAFMERINPYLDHRLEVTLRGNSLIIRKKPCWIVDRELVELYEQRAKRLVTQQLYPKHPFDFHVRYYWEGKINFSILNNEIDASWKPIANVKPSEQNGGIKKTVRKALLAICRQMFSQTEETEVSIYCYFFVVPSVTVGNLRGKRAGSCAIAAAYIIT